MKALAAAWQAPTYVQLHKYKACAPVRATRDRAIPVELRAFSSLRPDFRLAHRLLSWSSVNDDCRLTDRQGQRWPRCRDRATYRVAQSSHRDHFPRKPVHLCHRSSVTVSFAAPKRSSLLRRRAAFRHARENGLAHFTSARLLLPALLQSFPTRGTVMAYLAPSEFVTKMVDAGESKIFMSTRDTVIRAYMAGRCPRVGGLFAVTISADRHADHRRAAVSGRLLHALSVRLRPADGRVRARPLALIDRRPGVTLGGVLRNWGLVFIGNFAGAFTVAVMMAIVLPSASRRRRTRSAR